ncbi:MAG: LytTR family transcriptional regulator DNA-binding domain-containing protein [Pyrinomonadaceae bacterium]
MKRTSKIRVLIVDDEPFARERVRQLLEGDADIEIIGECGDGLHAAALIKEQSPELLFLDVQMPELDGFGVLERVEAERMPIVIFVTAYDKYAIRAFEACALDYLLKPYDEERFAKAVGRAKTQLGRGAPETESALGALRFAPAKEVGARTKYLERVVVKTGGRVYFFRTEEIDWIEAQGNYVRLHIGRAAYLLRETISSLEQELNPGKFVRIHRGTLVNVERIRELQPMFHGQHVVILRDGTELTLSRRHRSSLEAAIGRPI